MPSSEVEQVLQKLMAFRVPQRNTTGRPTLGEEMAEQEAIEELIRLAARLPASLDPGRNAHLRRRASLVDDRTRPGTEFHKAFMAVVDLRKKKQPRSPGVRPSEHTYPLECEDTSYIAFPLLLAGAWARAEDWMLKHPDPPACNLVERWRDELWKISVEAEREHFWGSHLICLCEFALDPGTARIGLYRLLQGLFGGLKGVTKAIQEAAWDLCRNRARHSADYRSVDWFGIHYDFTALQAPCIECLWEAWENGTPDLGQEFIMAQAGAESRRLVDLFKGHGAWGTMIVPGATKGAYRLQEPRLPPE
jgi:hypothetical protein